MKKLLSAIGYDNSLELKNRYTYIIAAFSFFLVALFLLFYIIGVKNPIINIFTSICLTDMGLVFLFLKKRRFHTAKLMMLLGFLMQEFSLVFLWFPKEAGFHYFLFLIAPITFFIYDFQIAKERVYLFSFNIVAIILIVMNETFRFSEPRIIITPELGTFFTVASLLSTALSILIVFYAYASNLSATHKELEFLANTDMLTKTYNRRTLYREGDTLFTLSRGYSFNFAFLIFDIDFFKRINDTYGHLAGDSVLIQLTKLISNNIRHYDIFSRYGGEEFGLLLKDSSREGNLKAAENLRKVVEDYEFRINEETTEKLTISIGVVNYSSRYKNFDQMVQIADEALYQAKNGGRNRIVGLD